MPGFSGQVFAFGNWNNKLVAGGDFDLATPGYAAVAVYDTSSWVQLGGGFDGTIYAFTAYQGSLVVGGGFRTVAGDSVGLVASWDGTSWQALGAGLSGSLVRGLAVVNGALYAAGNFTTAGGLPSSSIARWDGTNWFPLDSGLNGTAFALAEWNSTLIVGGDFTQAGGAPALNIAQWNGTAWSSMGSGLNSIVRALVVHKGDLIAGGYFGFSGSQQVKRIALWSQGNWVPVGIGFNSGGVLGLNSDNTTLYACGTFVQSGSVTLNRVAQFTEFSWCPMGRGLYFHVDVPTAILVNPTNVFVGGIINYVGMYEADNMAAWVLTPDVSSTTETRDGHDVAPTLRVLSIVPRPQQVLCEVGGLPAGEFELQIFTIQGRLLETKLIHGSSSRQLVSVNLGERGGPRLAAGMYVARLFGSRHLTSTKFIL